jgi:hypothetical protein
MVSLGLDLHWGYTGLFDIGIVGFMAVGIYVMALVSKPIYEPGSAAQVGGLGLPLIVGIVAGMVAAALLGLVIALPALRLRADYLAIVTIAMSEIVRFSLLSSQFQQFQLFGRRVGFGGGSGLILNYQDPLQAFFSLFGLWDAYLGLVEATRVIMPTNPKPVVDGLVYGANPRNGFFRDGTFLHPDLAFRLDFPDDWKRQNLARAVVAQSPGGDAILQLTFADADTHGAAARAFFGQEGMRGTSGVGTTRIHGLPATTGVFVASTDRGDVQGRATFLEYGGRVYQLLGYTARADYRSWERTFRASHESFRRLEDREALNVEPMRIRIITTDRAGTMAQLLQRRSAPVDASTLALLNAVDEGERIPAGTTLKWVEGEKLPEN